MIDTLADILSSDAAPWWASGVSALLGFLVGWVPSYLNSRASDRRAFSLDLQRSNIRAVEEACSDFLLACEKAATFANSIPQFSSYSPERESLPFLSAEQDEERQRIADSVTDSFFRVALISPPNVQGRAQSYLWHVNKMLSSASDKEFRETHWNNMDLNIHRGVYLGAVRSACGIDQLPVYRKQEKANRKHLRREAKYRRKQEKKNAKVNSGQEEQPPQ